MTGEDEKHDAARMAAIISFPFSRVPPPRAASAEGPVYYGALATALHIPHEQTTGHWCSRCSIIWYGYLLEVACPACGNRHG